MPRRYIERHLKKKEGSSEPFSEPHEVNILLEVATTRASDLEQDGNGTPKLQSIVENALMDMIENNNAQDAVIAQNETQRRAMWERREAAAEITFGIPGSIDTDIAVPLDNVPIFLEQVSDRVKEIDSTGEEFYIAHLGDGNLHYPLRRQRQMCIRDRSRNSESDFGCSLTAFPHGAPLSFILCNYCICLLYTSPSPRDGLLSRMPSSA